MHKADYSLWAYVSLHDLNNDPRRFIVKYYRLMCDYREWLVELGGAQKETWDYCPGQSGWVMGIYFKEPQDAIVFKLKFGL